MTIQERFLAGARKARTACQAELAACEAGAWPRDLNDYMRWGLPRGASAGPRLTGKEEVAARRTWAATCCQVEIRYVDGLEARIAAGERPWG